MRKKEAKSLPRKYEADQQGSTGQQASQEIGDGDV